MPLPIGGHRGGRAAPLPVPVPGVPEVLDREPMAAEPDPVPEPVLVADESEPNVSEIDVDAEPQTMRGRARSWQTCALGQRQMAERARATADGILAAARAEADQILARAKAEAGPLAADAGARVKRADGVAEAARVLASTAVRQEAANAADERVAALEDELAQVTAARAEAEAELTRLRAEQAAADAGLAAAVGDRDRDGQRAARGELAAVADEIQAAERAREAALARRLAIVRVDGELEAARRGQGRDNVERGLDSALAHAGSEPAAARVAKRREEDLRRAAAAQWRAERARQPLQDRRIVARFGQGS